MQFGYQHFFSQVNALGPGQTPHTFIKGFSGLASGRLTGQSKFM